MTAPVESGRLADQGWGRSAYPGKIVATAASQFVVIADSTKPVGALRPPIPLELLAFGLSATLRRLHPVALRDVPRSPDGGVIADYQRTVSDPVRLAARLSAAPVLVDGPWLVSAELVEVVLIGHDDEVERRVLRSVAR